MKKTSKKTRIVGRKGYIDQDTGEVVEMHVMDVEERDANFKKIWVGDIIQKLDIISNKKMDVVWYIIDNINSENILIASQRDMERTLGISLFTISETFKALQEGNFLTMVQNGVYRVNPEVVFKGGHNRRMNVLIRYRDEKAKNEEPEKAIEDEERILEEKLRQIQNQLDKIREMRIVCQSTQKQSGEPDKQTSIAS